VAVVEAIFPSLRLRREDEPEQCAASVKYDELMDAVRKLPTVPPPVSTACSALLLHAPAERCREVEFDVRVLRD